MLNVEPIVIITPPLFLVQLMATTTPPFLRGDYAETDTQCDHGKSLSAPRADLQHQPPQNIFSAEKETKVAALEQVVAVLQQRVGQLHQRVAQLEEVREQDKCYIDDLESYVHELKSRLDAL